MGLSQLFRFMDEWLAQDAAESRRKSRQRTDVKPSLKVASKPVDKTAQKPSPQQLAKAAEARKAQAAELEKAKGIVRRYQQLKSSVGERLARIAMGIKLPGKH